MDSRTIISAVAVCLLTLALSSTPAQAFDLGQWIPGLKVSPFLSERVEYESNVFQTPSHSKGDVIFKTIPGFLADYNFGPHSLSGGYRAEILGFVEVKKASVVRFDLVVKGTFWGEGTFTRGAPKGKFPLAVAFTLSSDP